MLNPPNFESVCFIIYINPEASKKEARIFYQITRMELASDLIGIIIYTFFVAQINPFQEMYICGVIK